MAPEYYFFPDRREADASLLEARLAHATSDSTQTLLDGLRRIDWAYPALVVYRESGDDRWSYVTLGLSLRELGED
jgi:hypothetical protein